ncbi:hypothetical protein HMF3257_10505 [Spirosoma telluris]|uniref:Uncharacterized protein n=2 Tax=Spirosoma telluris TaxID=2183553 RepID=A0A327NH02_9BACT|nr:hypothetical protein HMF3257_10505 [Spirosoma telluris]
MFWLTDQRLGDRVKPLLIKPLLSFAMGLCLTKIHFQEGMPPVVEISEQFRKQTGYGLWVNASLNLSHLGSLLEVSQALQRDFEEVIDIHKEHDAFKQNEPKNYEKQAQIRGRLGSLNHIKSLSFDTWFYDINFKVEDEYIVIESETGQVYAIESLVKVLTDLGGSFESADDLDYWQTKWRKLKPWDEYRWYNRPRK